AAHHEHPARGPEARLRVDQLLRDHDVGVVFEDPVATGDARIERSALDVAGHLLRANEEAAERRIVDAGEVAAQTGRDLPARAAEELDGRGLEAALGYAEVEGGHDGGLYQLVRGPRHCSGCPPGRLVGPSDAPRLEEAQ